MSADPRINQLRIRTGVLKRLVREKQGYEGMLKTETQRLNTMRLEGRDEYDINKQQEIINETVMLLPDCQKRITVAYNDLEKLVKAAQEPELEENEIFIAAKKLLNEVTIP